MKSPQKFTRWGPFEGAVLAKLKKPARISRLIAKRQTDVDDESNEADLVASYFRRKLGNNRLDPSSCCVFLTTAEVTEFLIIATGTKIPVTRATPYLKNLVIPELAYTKKNGVPGWVWRGPKAGKKQRSVVFAKLNCIP